MVVMRYYEPDAVLLAQEGEEPPFTQPRTIPEPASGNWSFVTLCRVWRIPIIYMLEAPYSPIKRTWGDSFFR